MENLNILRSFKQETIQMDFTYKNVHRLLFMIHQSKVILEKPSPIPNKDIAHDQIIKLIKNDVSKLINSDKETDVKDSFFLTLEGFKLILTYTK